MNKLFGRLAACATAFALCGCIAVGDIDRRATTINEEVGVTQNRALLLNLVRASNEEPIFFTSVGQMSAGGTTDFKAASPQFFAGPNLPPASKIATFASGNFIVDNNTNSSFQMTLLGTKDFYSGLMSPTGLNDVDLLLHQGYSRELIFYLVIDKATIAVQGSEAPPTTVFNDPASPTFGLFKYYIKEAMEHGLTTETYLAPDASADNSADSSGGSGGSGGRSGGGKPKLTKHAELCYDKTLALADDLKDIDPSSFCGAKPAIRMSASNSGAPLTVTLHDPSFPLHDQKLVIDVTERSIYGMYYYLGRIIRSGKEVDLEAFNLPAENVPQAPLITVDTSARLPLQPGGCFTVVGYEGKTYCVPLENSDNTKHIFGILFALLALHQTVNDQNLLPTVRIQQ